MSPSQPASSIQTQLSISQALQPPLSQTRGCRSTPSRANDTGRQVRTTAPLTRLPHPRRATGIPRSYFATSDCPDVSLDRPRSLLKLVWRLQTTAPAHLVGSVGFADPRGLQAQARQSRRYRRLCRLGRQAGRQAASNLNCQFPGSSRPSTFWRHGCCSMHSRPLSLARQANGCPTRVFHILGAPLDIAQLFRDIRKRPGSSWQAFSPDSNPSGGSKISRSGSHQRRRSLRRRAFRARIR